MDSKPIRLLLLEDDVLQCEAFKNYINCLEEVKLVGITNSSDKALELFKECMPQAVIVDIELHNGQGSGIEFLEKVREYFDSFKPIIIVTTNSASNILYDNLHTSGVDLIFYKQQKDYSPKLVISDLLSLKKSFYKYNNINKNLESMIETPEEHDKKIEKMINSELDLIGISSHLKGRKYIFDAIMYLIKQEENKDYDTVFNHLAAKYKISASSVSRVMETSINRAWKTSAPDELETYYTAKINYNTGVPSPTEFIYYYSEKIKKKI